MIVFQILAWIVLIVFALFMIIILAPMRYDFCVFWQDKFSGKIHVGAGPFQVCFNWITNGANTFELQLAGITLLEKPLAENEKSRKASASKKNKEQKKKEAASEKKSEKKNQREKRGDVVSLLDLLDEKLIRAILRTVRDILRHSLPKVMQLEGILGFANPYYTGILAAIRATVPGIQVEPDFTGEVRDLRVIIQGRIRLAVLLFYGLRFIVSQPARPILKKLFLNKRKPLNLRKQFVNLGVNK